MSRLTDMIAANTVEDGDCLRWTGACAGKTSHPYFSDPASGRKCVLVRRAQWEAAHGPIPAGHIIRCTCQTPKCVNLEHCELTTFGKLAKQLGALGVMSGPVRSAKIAASHRQRHPFTKLTQDQARAIRESDEAGTVLAQRYGVGEGLVSKIRLGKVRREFGGNVWQGLGA